MPKYFLTISLLLVMAVFGFSCKKVINVKLDPGATQYVIEGVVNDQSGLYTVSITTTKDFSGDNAVPGISGATVTIESDGVSYHLTDAGNGTYTTTAVAGRPGKTYKMTVSLKGSLYTASSTMPQPIAPDTVYVGRDDLSDKLYAKVVYTDPAGVRNYYRWVQYVNGRKEKTVFGADDEFTDGLTLTEVLNFSNDTDDSKRDIHVGDTIRVDMLCLDSAVYKYWDGLNREASGSGGSAAPANPIGNITGGCLGYFSAQTVRSKTLVVGK